MDVESVTNCPVCDGPDRRLLYHGLTDRNFGAAPDEWNLYRCMDCGAAYLDPRPARDVLHQAYASYYTHVGPTIEPVPTGPVGTARRALRNGLVNERYGYDLRPATRRAHALLALAPGVRGEAERLFRHLPKRARVLDVGCGSGEFVAHAELVGWQATGIDVDRRALEAGRTRGYDLRAETLSEHADSGYDAITMNHVIEHVADPVELLKAAHERLRPDGLLWLATPNLAALGHRRFRETWLGIDAPRHLVLFDHDSLQLALSRAGFGEAHHAPHSPIAGEYFRLSAAVRRGDSAGARSTARAPLALRVLGGLADRAARHNPRLGEELVVLASWRSR